LGALLDTAGVTLHGRDLRADGEGTGVQLQYLRDARAGSASQACFVVDITIQERGVASAWQITTTGLLADSDGNYRVVQDQTHTLFLRDLDCLRALFRDTLLPIANAFFAAAAAEAPRNRYMISDRQH
jgi:hypothetical protein